jgi:outer membrane immunogenic protein
MSVRAMAGENMPMNARKLLRAMMMLMLAMGAATALARPTAAQSSAPKFEFGADYNFVRANGPPGTCACFSMNGGNGWIGYGLGNGFSVAGEFSGQHAGDINGSGEDLTLVSYLFGPKYSWRAAERWQPFGQVLLGGAHASGTFEPSVKGGSGSYNSFAMIAGGGMDIAASEHLAVRAVEADYYLTQFPNGVNGRQNNFRISAGVIFRF